MGVMDTYLEGGYYQFDVIYGVRSSTNNCICIGRVTLSRVDVWVKDVILTNLPFGSNRFVLQYALNNANGNTMKDAKLTLIRVS